MLFGALGNVGNCGNAGQCGAAVLVEKNHHQLAAKGDVQNWIIEGQGVD